MTTFETVDTHPAAEVKVKRDRWGRYRLPHPDTGKEQSWTRATTLAGTLADRYGLEQWDKRNVVLGIGSRRDLYAQAAAATPYDTDTLNGIVDQAKEAAKGKAGANMGSALHRLSERVDAGQLTPGDIDDPELRTDIEAYAAAMSAAGVAVAPGWLERILLVPEIDVAGTCDRLCTAADWALPRIGDVKTGKDVVRWGMAEIPLQLAIYAHATHWYDPATGQLHEMPPVDQERALVMHLPAGQGTCTLYEVDIRSGWEAVQLAVAVRQWRKRNDLAEQVPTIAPAKAPADEAPSSPPAAPGRVDWLRERVLALAAAGHKADVAAHWPPGVPTIKQGGLTDDHVAQIAQALDQVEAQHGTPFGPPDPAAAAVTEQPAPAPPAEPERRPAPNDEAAQHTRDAQNALAEQDPAEARAIRDLLIPDAAKTTGGDVERIRALVHELDAPDGAVMFGYSTLGPVIEPAPDVGARVLAVTGTKTEALQRAKRLAPPLGRPTPRAFDHICNDPALAALVAAGLGRAGNETPPNTEAK